MKEKIAGMSYEEFKKCVINEFEDFIEVNDKKEITIEILNNFIGLLHFDLMEECETIEEKKYSEEIIEKIIKENFKIIEPKIKTNKLLVRDEQDGFYNVYLFEEEIEFKKIENIIKKVKQDKIGEWDLTDITQALKDNFKIKNIMYFDYISCNELEINKI